jgi:hypothetical protein
VRTITVAAIIASLTLPAYGQRNMGVASPPTQPQKTAQEKAAEEAQRKLDEKAYKDSLPGSPSATRRTVGKPASLTICSGPFRNRACRKGSP